MGRSAAFLASDTFWPYGFCKGFKNLQTAKVTIDFDRLFLTVRISAEVSELAF